MIQHPCDKSNKVLQYSKNKIKFGNPLHNTFLVSQKV
jgi:hypothetical protein